MPASGKSTPTTPAPAGSGRCCKPCWSGCASAKPGPTAGFAQAALEAVQTNITLPDMALLAARVLLHGGEMTQYRVPAEGTYESGILNGVWSIRPDFEANQNCCASSSTDSPTLKSTSAQDSVPPKAKRNHQILTCGWPFPIDILPRTL